jgi:hypothetical protein
MAFRGILVFLLAAMLVTLLVIPDFGTPTQSVIASSVPTDSLPAPTGELTWEKSVILVFDSLKRLEESDKRIEAKVDTLNTALSTKLEQHTADIASIKAQVAIIASLASILVSTGFNLIGGRKQRNGNGKTKE